MKRVIKKLFLLSTIVIFSICASTLNLSASTITVTTLAGDGSAGSLKEAVSSAHAYDVIVFSVSGVIKLSGRLEINVPLTIDGSTQSSYSSYSNLNPAGIPQYLPIVTIDCGSYWDFDNSGAYYVGIEINSDGVTIKALQIENAWQGIDQENFTFEDNSSAAPSHITNCVITKCWTGIETDLPNTFIQGNYIGNDAASSTFPYAMARGIDIGLEDYLSLYYSQEMDDVIGEATANPTTVTNANIIQNCNYAGVEVYSGFGNIISANIIFHDVNWSSFDIEQPPMAIKLMHANQNKHAPNIQSAYFSGSVGCTNSLQGTSEPYDIIQVFKNTDGTDYGKENANTYLGNTTANSAGAWTFCFPSTYTLGSYDMFTATATRTNGGGNTHNLKSTSQLAFFGTCPFPVITDVTCSSSPVNLEAVIPPCTGCTYTYTWSDATSSYNFSSGYDYQSTSTNVFSTPTSSYTYEVQVQIVNSANTCTIVSDATSVY